MSAACLPSAHFSFDAGCLSFIDLSFRLTLPNRHHLPTAARCLPTLFSFVRATYLSLLLLPLFLYVSLFYPFRTSSFSIVTRRSSKTRYNESSLDHSRTPSYIHCRLRALKGAKKEKKQDNLSIARSLRSLRSLVDRGRLMVEKKGG